MADIKDYSPYLDYAKERKKMTNTDKIRAMSDEELADYLRYYSDSYARYDMDWLDWLRQEVEE